MVDHSDFSTNETEESVGLGCYYVIFTRGGEFGANVRVPVECETAVFRVVSFRVHVSVPAAFVVIEIVINVETMTLV